jgi:hypothetical protein
VVELSRYVCGTCLIELSEDDRTQLRQWAKLQAPRAKAWAEAWIVDEQYRDKRKELRFERERRRTELCKQVTDNIAKAGRWLWRKVIVAPSRFGWQVLCWLWIVLKSKKKKWCPYFQFE